VSIQARSVLFPRLFRRLTQDALESSRVCLYIRMNMSGWFWKMLGVRESSPASRKKLGLVALLYFIQGAPAAILWEVLPVYFRLHGVSLRAIGGLRLLELLYSFRFFCSLLVHRYVDGRIWLL